MAIPTHRDSCITKAFPTNCPDCKEDVWFFKCNCGSKIYFQDLGWPWEQHVCRDRVIREAIQLIKTSERLSDEEIYRRIASFATERTWVIPEEIVELLDFELGKRKTPLKNIRISDLTTVTNISGMVMSINRDVSFIRRFDLDPNNQIHKGLAGDILSKSYSEVFVREHPNKQNECREFVVYVEKNYLKNNPIVVSKTILANLIKIKSKKVDLWEISEHQCY